MNVTCYLDKHHYEVLGAMCARSETTEGRLTSELLRQVIEASPQWTAHMRHWSGLVLEWLDADKPREGPLHVTYTDIKEEWTILKREFLLKVVDQLVRDGCFERTDKPDEWLCVLTPEQAWKTISGRDS